MKISEVKREFQLQQWRGMVQERKESRLSVMEWCAGCGITEHVYYYRNRNIGDHGCGPSKNIRHEQLRLFVRY